MPHGIPRLCGCGHVVPHGVRCACQVKRDADRKRRADLKRPNATERGYDAQWRQERAAFLKTSPKCVRCGAPAVIVDHIQPHRGDMRKFWDRSNWQALCRGCHSRWKQSREKRR